MVHVVRFGRGVAWAWLVLWYPQMVLSMLSWWNRSPDVVWAARANVTFSIIWQSMQHVFKLTQILEIPMAQHWSYMWDLITSPICSLTVNNIARLARKSSRFPGYIQQMPLARQPSDPTYHQVCYTWWYLDIGSKQRCDATSACIDECSGIPGPSHRDSELEVAISNSRSRGYDN